MVVLTAGRCKIEKGRRGCDGLFFVAIVGCSTVQAGYRHLARTLATQTGMMNDWLKIQGLIGVRDLWMKSHGYA